MAAPESSKMLQVILPPADDNASTEEREALSLIRNLGGTILPKRKVHKFFLETINTEGHEDESARVIQGERLEIFFRDAEGKTTKSLDEVLNKHGLEPNSTKQSIMNYAIQQARRDERLEGKDLQFSNFSLILNYGSVPEQAPHVDLLEPNFQFGLIMTTGPGTISYDEVQKIETVDDLCEAWNRIDAIDKTGPIPPQLVNALKLSNDAQHLLRGFGSVLVADEEMQEAAQNHPDLPVGTLLSLPGSVVHAGPKYDGFRAVLFFTAWPKGSKVVEEYHPDTQYANVFLCGRLTQLIWRQAGMDYKARKYLLQKLYRYIRQGGSTPKHKRVKREWALHFPEVDSFVDFISKLEKDRTSRQTDSRLIARAAREESLIFYNVMGSENDASITGDFVKVSVPNLQTKWGDKAFDVEIFQRPGDRKVLVYYPNDGSQTGYSWEGALPEDTFSIEPIPPLNVCSEDMEWFDGTNGRLVDSDGTVVACFRAPPQSQTGGMKREAPNPDEVAPAQNKKPTLEKVI